MNVILDKHAYMPEKAHDLDAGYDLRAMKGHIVPPHKIRKLDTGVHIELPKNTTAYIKNRSSMFSQGIVTDGTIDAGYTGSIKVVVHNTTAETVLIKRGSKIAQLVIHPILSPEFTIVESFSETERGDGGFGSTGE